MSQSVTFPYKQSYEVLGALTPYTRRIIWVFHGYGQLASSFINVFEPLVSSEVCFIAPQALSRFYLSGFTGRVGASWMTSYEREQDIANYLTYLEAIHAHILKTCPRTETSILGFSQGAATASRWALSKAHDVSHLILCGGFLAAEIDNEALQRRLARGQFHIHFVYGDKDSLVTTILPEIEERINSLSTPIKTHIFDGKHIVNIQIIKDILG